MTDGTRNGVTVPVLPAEHRLEIQAHTAALEAFVAFTEASDSETDVRVLAQRAIRMLRVHFVGARVAYFERGDPGEPRLNGESLGWAGPSWTGVAWSENVYPDDLALMTARDAPKDLRMTLPDAQVSVFRDPDAQQFGGTPPPSGPVGQYSLIVEDQVLGLLSIELEGHTPWTALNQGVFRAVGRSLALALERAQSVKKLAQHARDLEDSTVKLKRANEELEAFTYGVSHDLRTPLRHIKGFSQLLRGALGRSPGEKVTRYLGVIDDAVGRMNTLIDAMMDLSVTSRLPLRKGVVPLDTLLAEARAQAEVDGVSSQVEWTVGPLPTVTGDPDALRLVLVNLLSNALKFSRTRDHPHIEVWAEQRPQEWAIFVRDNGVGFDPLYQDRLFQMFQRLHREDEFGGTGVGLTSVRRAITRHGGTVFAMGVPAEGATFGFTLPRIPTVPPEDDAPQE